MPPDASLIALNWGWSLGAGQVFPQYLGILRAGCAIWTVELLLLAADYDLLAVRSEARQKAREKGSA
jgi:hypothetical protein